MSPLPGDGRVVRALAGCCSAIEESTSSMSFDRPSLIQHQDCIIAEKCMYMICINGSTCDPVCRYV